VEKILAIILSATITLLIAFNIYLLNLEDLESVIIKRVIDGDTFELEDGRIIRLLNINSPEKSDKFSELSFNFLKQYENKTIEIEVTGKGIYGRDLARAYSGEYLNLYLIEQGYSHISHIELSEKNKFFKTQQKAFEQEKGIWKKSEFYGCLNVEIYEVEEYIVIKNACQNMSLNLKDESTKSFKINLPANSQKKIFSNKGEDTEDKIYLNSGNIWNNDIDSIFIRDEKGYLVYYSSYGY